MRAEARLSIDPEFLDRRSLAAWDETVLHFTREAAELGLLRDGFTAEKLVRVLAASMAGHRLLAHIVPVGAAVSISSGYRESLETVLAAATTANVPRSR